MHALPATSTSLKVSPCPRRSKPHHICDQDFLKCELTLLLLLEHLVVVQDVNGELSLQATAKERQNPVATNKEDQWQVDGVIPIHDRMLAG